MAKNFYFVTHDPKIANKPSHVVKFFLCSKKMLKSSATVIYSPRQKNFFFMSHDPKIAKRPNYSVEFAFFICLDLVVLCAPDGNGCK